MCVYGNTNPTDWYAFACNFIAYHLALFLSFCVYKNITVYFSSLAFSQFYVENRVDMSGNFCGILKVIVQSVSQTL